MAAAPPERLFTWRFGLLSASGVGYYTAQGMTYPLLPRYVERVLDLGDVAVGLVVGMFALGAVLVRPIAGLIGDRIGRRFLVVVGATAYAASVALYDTAADLGGVGLLLLPRALSGFSGGMIYVGQATMATEMAPPARQGEAVSLYSTSIFGGQAVGPIVGEWLLDTRGFEVGFAVAAGFAALSALCALGVPETRVRRPAGEPAPRRRLLHPAAIRPGFLLFLGVFTTTAFLAFVALHAEDMGIDDVGPVFTTYALATLVLRVTCARLPDRLTRRTLGTVSLLGTASAGFVLGLWRDAPALYLAAVLLAVGMAFLFPTFILAGVDLAPASERASVVGTTTAFNDVAAGGGAFLLGTIASATDYGGAFLVAGCCATAGLVLLRVGFVPSLARGAELASARQVTSGGRR